MIARRNFLGSLFGLVAAPLAAQKVIMEGDKAVTCDSTALKCPNGHWTCPKIDAPLAVGNDSYQNPEVNQMRDYHLIRCDQCHVLFTRE